jgi:TRAP-type C4-dicarboxylate transport system permease small subunit
MARKIISRIVFWFNWLGQWPLLALMPLLIVPLIMRRLMLPTTGFYEVILVLALFVYASSWPYAEERKVHVRVEIVVQRLSSRVRLITGWIVTILSLATCALMVWAFGGYGYKLQVSGQVVSPTIQVPMCLLSYLVAFSFLVMGAVMAVQLLDLQSGREKKN